MASAAICSRASSNQSVFGCSWASGCVVALFSGHSSAPGVSTTGCSATSVVFGRLSQANLAILCHILAICAAAVAAALVANLAIETGRWVTCRAPLHKFAFAWAAPGPQCRFPLLGPRVQGAPL